VSPGEASQAEPGEGDDATTGDSPGDAGEAPRRGPPPVVWKRTWVDDRPAFYGLAGDGLPVVLLHGWALGHHTYREVVQRIAGQGARVWAPALPGFAGTHDLPSKDFTLGGYGRWLDSFLRVVGLEEKVVVVGHSFGGGVAIRFAHDHPDRVRSLVLVNSIGGSSWRRGQTLTSIAERPLWDWGLHFPGDIFPIRQATRVLPVILQDAVQNMIRNPRSLVRVAALARRADLRGELEQLKFRGTPVTVLWGSRDGIIPKESFEAMCVALGAQGKVIDGSHSWLLADPDAFGEVITNDLTVARVARELEAATPPKRRLFGGRRPKPRELASLTGEPLAVEPEPEEGASGG
jgi:pimeloyl-ACP methyl ester carboxylesterase